MTNNRVRAALPLTTGELQVYYHPIATCSTQVVVGVEALIRWQHPQQGMILPDEFIPIAEAKGIVRDLDLWVLQTACQQTQAWHRAGYPVFVAVNVSGLHLNQPEFSHRVEAILTETGLDPAFLKLELTETVLVQDMDSAIAHLENLKALGVQIWLDDFGTGYSHLYYLQQLPFDGLKIDRCFLASLTANCKDAILVYSAIQLARNLGLKAIAEGVETQVQQELLSQYRCDFYQGYWLSLPLTAKALEKMFLLPRRGL